jgi:hypothetical protein
MGMWYTIGLLAGLGVALGVLLAGGLATTRAGIVAAAVLAAAAATGLGFAFLGWPEAVGGGIGGALGALGASQFLRGALQRGGTRAGTAALLALAAVVLAVLALVPVVGYLQTVAVPALAARLRRRSSRTYAGLRILARD